MILLGVIIRLLLIPAVFKGLDLFLIYSLCPYPPVMYYIKNLITLVSFDNVLLTVFVFKLPYLLADFGIGYLMYKLQGKTALKIWLFNPFVLFTFAVGQFDVIPAFFIMLAVYMIKNNKLNNAVVLLVLGAFTKIIPVLLLPVILVKHNKKQVITLVLVSSAFILLPMLFNLKQLSFMSFSPTVPLIRKLAFGVLYLYILYISKQIKDIVPIFTVILLLLFCIYFVTIRYFVMVTPLLILVALKDKKFWIYNVIFFITLFELRALGDKSIFITLIEALKSEFYYLAPIHIDIKILHQIVYRIFFVTGIVACVHILRKELR